MHAEDMLTTPNYAYFDEETTVRCRLSWLLAIGDCSRPVDSC